MVRVGEIYKPTDSRRDNRRIRVVHIHQGYGHWLIDSICPIKVESRLVGERKWKPAPSIRLDRLESRHYKLVKGV